MKRILLFAILLFLLSPVALHAQIGKIGEFPAGLPRIKLCKPSPASKMRQKRVAMYEDFTQKFASNPSAVAYGNWQIAQYYQASGDSQKAHGLWR